MPQPKRILICPLEWGLGHATRCIPVIRLLLEKKAEVFIAADGQAYELLKKEFPSLEIIRLKGYAVSYPLKGSMVFKMLSSIPSILKGIRREHQDLQRIISSKKIDVVISDNRFGCYGKGTKNIFITHQLMIKSPFGEGTLKKINRHYIDKYDECWIPDLNGKENLAGDLSHIDPMPEHCHYIGPLSRFQNSKPVQGIKRYDIMAVISGPEPQRTLFERIVFEELKKSGLNSLMVLGQPSEQRSEEKVKIEMVSHLGTAEMEQALLSSDIILCRSGYSSIMDLSVLGKKAIFVPTPGQTEQEYLSKLLAEKGIAFSMAQKEFDLSVALKNTENFIGFSRSDVKEELSERIENLLN